jgi:hypothetical protein
MKSNETLKVMTANLLREGDVVYLSAEGTWSPWLREAEVAADAEGAARLEAAAAKAVADRLVVGPYLMQVAKERGWPQPLGSREKIRAKGPTTHLDFGKQAADA